MFTFYLALWLSLPRFVRTLFYFVVLGLLSLGFISYIISSFEAKNDLLGLIALASLVAVYYFIKKKLFQHFRNRKAKING